MKPRLKKLSEQVLVITGASSGIGLATARKAARHGARLVLAARNASALDRLAEELTAAGAEVATIAADVGKEAEVREIARLAVQRFGGFDTWVNNAGVSIYGRIEQVPLEDQRRLFDTNYWGVVYGSLAAAEHLKRKRGGAIVNVGSSLCDAAVPLQGAYVASKHAVKGFTDAIRLELESQRAPVSVTLVKPGAIDTMYLAHAKNYMEVEPRFPRLVYSPEAVADAILEAATHPHRDIYVGAPARLFASAANLAPRTTDRLLRRLGVSQQRSRYPAREAGRDGLHSPGPGLHERQGHSGHVMRWSAYTQAATHPKSVAALMLGTGLAAALFWRNRARLH